MSLTTPTQLAAYLRTDSNAEGLQEALDVAEAAIASVIGTPTLEQEAGRTHSHRVSRDGKQLFVLPTGPATALEAVTIDGQPESLEDWTLRGYWSAQMATRSAPIGSRVVLTYTTGWTSQTAPQGVRQAVLITAASVFQQKGEGVMSESIDNATLTFARADGQVPAVPPRASLLVAPYRSPE